MSKQLLTLVLATASVLALPVPDNNATITNSNYGPVPGESETYNTYGGKTQPFPANYSAPIMPTENGSAGPDDLLFQNLLSAEWAIYSFYQQAVEAFNVSSFTQLGLPNTTYGSITSIRDNEAGHLRIFQDSISPTSIKPGVCKYDFGWSNAEEWLATQVDIEVGSMAFLTGLVRQANTDTTRSALVAIAEVESRHNAWALMEIWGEDPFGGPADTVFPYANQILDITNQFIIPGSCPKENPSYPLPSQKLPTMSFDKNTTTGRPGSNITFVFPDAANQPDWYEQQADREYYAVYFHGVNNVTQSFDTRTNVSSIPAEFDSGRGVIVVVIADEVGAPTLDSVVAGPLIIVEQPQELTLKDA